MKENNTSYRHYIVSSSRSTVKSLGWQALTGKKKDAFLVCLFLILIPLAFDTIVQIIPSDSLLIESAANVISAVLMGTLTLGSSMFFLKNFRGENVRYTEVFHSFKFWGKAFILFLLRGLMVVLGLFLFIFPGIFTFYRTRMAFFILAENPEKNPLICLRESTEMMDGNKMSLFKLDFSFFGWIALSAVPFIAVTLFFAFKSFPVKEYMEALNAVVTNPAMSAAEFEGLYDSLMQLSTDRLAEMINSMGAWLYVLINNLPRLFFIFAEAYMTSSYACFYEFAKGNIYEAAEEA